MMWRTGTHGKGLAFVDLGWPVVAAESLVELPQGLGSSSTTPAPIVLLRVHLFCGIETLGPPGFAIDFFRFRIGNSQGCNQDDQVQEQLVHVEQHKNRTRMSLPKRNACSW